MKYLIALLLCFSLSSCAIIKTTYISVEQVKAEVQVDSNIEMPSLRK